MSQVPSPDISRYEKLGPFFEDFYALNKEKNKKFSYQYLANKLGWSAPYLNDIFKGRKRLSLSRALEFIEFLEMKGLAAERFLILFLADSDSSFATSPLKQEALSARNSSLKPSTFTLEEFITQFETIYEYYVLFYIHFNQGVWNAKEFLAQLTLTTKPPPENLEKLLRRLVKQKRLLFDEKTKLYAVAAGEHELFQVDASMSKEEALRLQITRSAMEHSGIFLDYLKKPIPLKSTFFVGLVSLDQSMYEEVKLRISALHNYLMELSAKAQATSGADPTATPGAQSRVWQYQLNLFSVFEDPAVSQSLPSPNELV